MAQPWEDVALADYESHMRLDSVMQLQTMSELMKKQFAARTADSVMVLGIAGGKELEHIHQSDFFKVCGVDVNAAYLQTVVQRHPELDGCLERPQVDLAVEVDRLPRADLVIANLLIEYIGCTCFQNAILTVGPE